MDHRHVLITGVSAGLGRALVGPLVRRGLIVTGCGRSADALAELCRRHPGKHRFDAVDVARWSEVEAWAEAVLASSGAPDLLVNNAGVINRCAPLWQLAAEEVARVVEINLLGTANTIRAFLPAMIEAGRGVVVNMSSGWGRSAAPEVAPYCASKFGVEGLTRALAQELPPGLAAVTVNPGVIDTAMLRSCWSDAAAACASPERWAETAVPFLLGLSSRDNGAALTAP